MVMYKKLCQKLTIIILFLIIIVVSVSASDEYTPVFHPELQVTKTTEEIKIDGYLEDPGWQGVAEANHFHERNPGDNIKPIVKTRAFITYNETHLFLSAICYDNPDEIRSTLSSRDRMGGDNIGFFFDTYGDAAWAYTINVNPFGVQADALWSDGFGEDGMFDLVFESAGQVTDSGYQVELAIPFTSLRFPNIEEQVWRMQFWRHHYRDTHYNITWAANDRNESNWVRNWGYIKGIKNVKPGKGIEIIPALTSTRAGALITNNDSTLTFNNDDAKAKLSLSGKYSISSNVTFDATINPDFSNVETDRYQIDVNSATALSYPEKRPFFQEGSDLYRTRLNLVYTRSINIPDYAAKLTARLGSYSISYLGAHDKKSPFIIPFEETSSGLIEGGESFSNILRVRKTLGSGSQVGLLFTDRHWDENYKGSNSTYGTDATFSLSKQLTLRAQVVGSYTKEPDSSNDLADGVGDEYFDDSTYTTAFNSESFDGYATYAKLSFVSSNFVMSSTVYEYSPTFRADNGWITRNGRRNFSMYFEYVHRIPKGLIEVFDFELNPIQIWNTDGDKKYEAIYASTWMSTRLYQLSVLYQYMNRNEDFAGIYYGNLWRHYIRFNTSPSELLTVGTSLIYGNLIAYGYNTVGRQTQADLWIDLNLFDRVYYETWISHVKSDSLNTGGEIFNGFVYGSRISYQYNRKLSARLLVQYDDFGKEWDFDPLITYKITPFTLFYLGSSNHVAKFNDLNQDGTRIAYPNETQYSHNKLTSRQYFMKLQYLFQL